MLRFAFLVLAMICYCLQGSSQNFIVYKVNYKLQVQKDLQAHAYYLVPRNKKLIMHYYDIDCDCFHVQYKDIYGIVRTDQWLHDAYWYPRKKNPDLIDTTLAENAHRFLIENIAKLPIKQTVSDQENAKQLMLIKQYGYTDGINIASGNLWLGMTTKMALDSWGIPYQIKRTTMNDHVSEKWIYSNAKLYFENEILTEIFRIVHE